MIPFHICNILITFMVSIVADAVLTIYIFGENYNWSLHADPSIHDLTDLFLRSPGI